MKIFPIALALLGTSMIRFSNADPGMQEGSGGRVLRALNGIPKKQETSREYLLEAIEAGYEEDDKEAEARRMAEWFYRRGKCCNYSGETEYALVDGVWQEIDDGECIGGWWSSEDCEGMTCGGGFYYIDGSTTGACVTPGSDSGVYTNRRWTPDPTTCDPGARSPSDRGGPDDNGPPGYPYGPRPTPSGGPNPSPNPAPSPPPNSGPNPAPSPSYSYPPSGM